MPEPSVQMVTELNKPAHVRYFLRCLKTHLPTAYTSNDSQRMTLAFFILCALDLLDGLDTNITASERAEYINWIYRCQHPDGGFNGFTGGDLGTAGNEANRHWDPANIAATYFALANLAILGDDLSRLDRGGCLKWLKRLQREDGTFGEAVGLDMEVQGERDMRFCYCAAATRWILDGGREREEDIDVDGLLRFFEASQTYEGGFANGPFHEAHAGWTYCAIGAMSLLGKPFSPSKSNHNFNNAWPSIESEQRLIAWLAGLQTSTLQEEDVSAPDVLESHAHADTDGESAENNFEAAHVVPPETVVPVVDSMEPLKEDLLWAGMTGRCNKMLNSLNLLDQNALRRYLIEKTQHRIGGFGKLPGDLPGMAADRFSDIMHSCLGLAGLAGMGEPGLKAYDPTLCLSLDIRRRLEQSSWRQGRSRSSV
ncbi:MAG: hypothetical protein Q9218_000061 [Villophora microphyllina]